MRFQYIFYLLTMLLFIGHINSFSQIFQKDTATVNANIKKAAELRYKDTQASIRVGYQALNKSKKINYDLGIAKSSFELAKAYFLIDDFKNSLEHAVRAIKISEKLKNDAVLSASYLALANIYIMQYNHKQGVKYLNKALVIKKRIGDTEGETNIYNNTGYSFYRNKNYDSALVHFRKSLAFGTKVKFKRGICNTLQNIGHVYNDLHNDDSALHYYYQSLPISIELSDLQIVSQNYLKIAGIYLRQKNLEKASQCLNEGLVYAEKMGISEPLCNYYKQLSILFENKNQLNVAYKFAKKYYTYSDSLNQSENSKRVNEMQFSYEIERKTHEQQLIDQKKQDEYEAGLERRNIIVYAAIGGMFLVLILLVFIYRNYRQKRKANDVLKEKNDLIEEQKKHVEEKNKDITDSINYAKRIQLALLKEQKHVSQHLPEHFIFFRPKDIVAGDFYWAAEKQDHLYLTAADCTGHGVPGAFLTMLGVAFLNEINATNDLLTPAQILDKLRVRFIQELSQTGGEGENKDGMDISLMRLNLKTNEMHWAGANNPLWILKSDKGQGLKFKDQSGSDVGIDHKPQTLNFELLETKADKQPIGYTSQPKPFTNHVFQLQKGDSFYLFTDGFADQFGGPSGKKYKYSQLKEIFIQINNFKLEKQKDFLDNEFETWKGEYEQLDDVCVIGVRI